MGDTARGRLDGWKAIAAYLGKNERTVQRWAKMLGMPVHHVHGRTSGTVYAEADELDVWMRLNPEPLGYLAPPSLSVALHEIDQSPSRSARSTAHDEERWLTPRRIFAAAILIVLVGAAAVLGVRAFQAGPPVRISFAGNRLLAWDERDHVTWSYDFPTEERAVAGMDRPARFVDLDGDGRNEVVVAVATVPRGTTEVGREEIFCFSARGERLWRYAPQLAVRFGGREWTGPWRFIDLLEVPEANTVTIWASIAHDTWWPSFLVRLDPRGRATVRLVNSGVIYALNYTRTGMSTYVLAGGVNNGHGAGMLAVLDVAQPPAVSPQAAGPYHCDTCEDGPPYRYFVFPPSELNRILWPYNEVMTIRLKGRDIQVSAREVPQGNLANALYDLSDNFDLLSVTLSDGYPTAHATLEREGKVNHSLENCPERKQPKMVRRWDTTGTWTDVPVRWAASQK